MKLLLLRFLLMVDAALLFLLGGWLILAPSQVERAFHFQDLPPAVAYLIGMWGCVIFAMGWGYVVATTNPLRHRAWVQIGIARGALESLLGIIYLVRGIVTFPQAGLGAVVAAIITVAYIALYPREPALANSPAGTFKPAAPAS